MKDTTFERACIADAIFLVFTHSRHGFVAPQTAFGITTSKASCILEEDIALGEEKAGLSLRFACCGVFFNHCEIFRLSVKIRVAVDG